MANGVKSWTGRWLMAIAVAIAIVAWTSWRLRPTQPVGDATTARLNFALKDMAGHEVRLADFKGRPLVINFWATWCAPCRAEIPGFVALVDKYKEQQLAVLGVSTDDSPEELRDFATRLKVNYPLLVGRGHDDLIEAYGVSFVPITWLIRRDGTVYLKKEGTETAKWFESEIKALF